MLNIIIILAFAGVLVVSAGFAGVTFLQGVQSSLDAQITTQRLLDVATEVQSHMRLLDPKASGSYILALPSGATGAAPYAYNQVPSFITSNARAANGVPFEYCPYAQSNDSLGDHYGTITMASGATYDMGTYNWTNESSSTFYGGNDTASQNYLVDNNDNSSNVPTSLPPVSGSKPYGILVAAAPNQFYPPDCTSVTTDSSGAYPKVSGGIALVINNDYLNKTRVAGSMTDFHFYVSSAATGDGSGRDASNYIALGDALSIIQSTNAASAMIYLDGGTSGTQTYTLPTTNSAVFHGTRMYFKGITSGGGSPPILLEPDNGSPPSIVIDQYNMLSISNLIFKIGSSGTGTLTINGTLEMTDTSPTLTAATVQVYGGAIKGYSNAGNSYSSTITINGNVSVDGGGVITSSGPMVFSNIGNRGFNVADGHVYGGTTMQFISQSGVVPIIVKAGGDLVAGTGTMSIGPASGAMTGAMIIDPGGRFFGATNSAYRGNSSVISLNGGTLGSGQNPYGFFVHGEMDLVAQNTGSTTPGAIITYNGAYPTYGIVLASGGKFMFENNTSNAATIGTSTASPSTGIYDEGGSGFYSMGSSSSTNKIWGVNSCWFGANSTNLFTDSGAGNSAGSFTYTNTTTFPNGWYRMYNNSGSAPITCNLAG